MRKAVHLKDDQKAQEEQHKKKIRAIKDRLLHEKNEQEKAKQKRFSMKKTSMDLSNKHEMDGMTTDF